MDMLHKLEKEAESINKSLNSGSDQAHIAPKTEKEKLKYRLEFLKAVSKCSRSKKVSSFSALTR